MNARSLAISNENASIEASQQRAIAAVAAKPRTALEAMASRLQMSPRNLMDTLKATVFQGCRNDSEFAALIVVANEYGLNPLLKEIYAFPAKGGGVVPMIGVDGWNKLRLSHPQFDGLEYNDHFDDQGKLYAVEAVIYRKDHSRPTKVIEYMKECAGNTIPWQKWPSRMLHHRASIQCTRVALGFTGISTDDDMEFVGMASSDPVSLPPRQTIEEELGDAIPTFDKQTGEVFEADPGTGMTEVDEETARRLDAGETGDESEQEPGEVVEAAAPDKPAESSPQQIAIDKALAGCRNATSIQQLHAVETEWLRHRGAVDDGLARSVDDMITVTRRELRAKAD